MKDVIRKAQLSIVDKVYIPKSSRSVVELKGVNGRLSIVRKPKNV